MTAARADGRRRPRDESATTLYRDEFGIPHVYAPTLEDAAYAIGYAQAEDRLEELLKNYRRASGTMAEVFGPGFYADDLAQRIWRHEEISRTRYPQLSPKLRAVLEAYIAGVRRFMTEHPEQVPSWAQEIHPWDTVALSRYIIWGWPMGEAVHDLGAAGIRLTPPAYRGSNEMLIAPGRTAMKAPIAVVDPHLGWYGSFRFYEARLYARDDRFAVSGVSILGQPIPSLGHSRYCSVAMTTGGPDTSDVYEEEVNPDDPRSYRFDGEWRQDDGAHLPDRRQGRVRGEAADGRRRVHASRPGRRPQGGQGLYDRDPLHGAGGARRPGLRDDEGAATSTR